MIGLMLLKPKTGIHRRNRKHLLKSNKKPFQIIDPPSMSPNIVNNTPSFPISNLARPTEQTIQDGTSKIQTSPKSPVKS